MDPCFRSFSLKAAWLALVIGVIFGHSVARSQETRSLAGKWRVQSDPAQKGHSEQWFEKFLGHTTRLPGSMPENGYGDDVTVETKWTGQIVD